MNLNQYVVAISVFAERGSNVLKLSFRYIFFAPIALHVCLYTLWDFHIHHLIRAENMPRILPIQAFNTPRPHIHGRMPLERMHHPSPTFLAKIALHDRARGRIPRPYGNRLRGEG